ncbi:hypothetical protein [Priestia megaterium]|uniref:hypothetical protein n=1 Tax=Priestia megaterium TaxID=1404 RepID=UPI0016498B54|nr:hypothetical protein [Priestia megaterium]
MEVEVDGDGKVDYEKYEGGVAGGELKVVGERDKRGSVIELDGEGEIFRERVE